MGSEMCIRDSRNIEYLKEILPEDAISCGYFFHTSLFQFFKKNIPRLLIAFKIAKMEGIEEKLVIGGKQPTKLLFHYIKRLDLTNEVIYIGFLKNKELRILYSFSTAFILPSLHEGFGLPLLEAMACGCPVITSRCFSMKEIIGKNGLTVNPYDVKDIANAIIRLSENSRLRKKLRKVGLKYVKKFNWKRTAKEHLKVYQELLEGRECPWERLRTG